MPPKSAKSRHYSLSRQNSVKFCKILHCFVEKVSNVAISRFLVAFLLTHFGTLCYFLAFFGTIWVFLAFYAVLSRIRFVVIYALFRVKLFWLKPCSCKKVVFLHLCQHGCHLVPPPNLCTVIVYHCSPL